MTSSPPDKHRLVAALRARIEEDLATVERRQADTAAGAMHEENRAEHAKDTRATEDSYLARGLAERVTELRRNVGALVTVAAQTEDGDEQREHWLLVPGAAGIEVEVGDRTVRAVTPISPLGQALLGLEVGDEGAVRTPRGERRFEILSLA